MAVSLVLVVPEYNHGYPGLLKHVLDGYLKEYVHKAAGIVGVSAGASGGARAVHSLLPVVRKRGMVPIAFDLSFSHVQKVFDENGELRDTAYLARTDKFLRELIWMADTLRYGREHVSQS